VFRPGGIIAAWAYGVAIIKPEIDIELHHFHDVILGEYWQAENRLVEKEYVTIPFPFKTISAPPFYIEKQMDLPQLIGYLESWSATQRFIKAQGVNPTVELIQKLKPHWENQGEIKRVKWKLILKVGMMDQE
jgi:hypothetical protein